MPQSPLLLVRSAELEAPDSAQAFRRRCPGLPGPGRSRTESGRRGEAGERKEGRAPQGRRARWRAERRAGNARGAGPEPPAGRVPAMALRLVSDFDLRKDVLPWLRAQRVASAAAGARGGGPGAGGARPGQGRGAGAGRRGVESEWFLPRGFPGPEGVGGVDQRGSCLQPPPT